MVLDWEDGRLCVKMPNAGHLHAAGCDTEGRVLEGLESIYVGGFCTGEIMAIPLTKNLAAMG